MKLAIHDCPGSFSDRWITYCKQNNIDYKIVNCYNTNIFEQLHDCNGLMWHWNQEDYKAILFARQLTHSLELAGIKVFPDLNTCWHFDDKIGQKYLFEAINAPYVNSYVFYRKTDAYEWINNTSFPKVFKLRAGAGSLNVRLVQTKTKARKLVRKSFTNGFPSIDLLTGLKDRFWRVRRDKNLSAIISLLKGFGRLILKTDNQRLTQIQRGYAYFQDFIPDNKYDTRLIVIGNRCFGVRRYCRKGDFRASGSGIKAYDPHLFDKEAISIAFETSKKLNSQSVAFDFIKENNDHKIIEISYAFITGKFYDDCPGYWDNNLNWHEKAVNPQYFIIEDFLKGLEKNENPSIL